MNREHIAVALAILVLVGLIMYAFRPVKEGYSSADLKSKIFASETGTQVIQFSSTVTIGSSKNVNYNGVQTNIKTYNSSTNILTLGDGTTFKQYQIDSVPYLVHLSSNTRMNVFTISNLTISNEPNGIGVRLESVSHLSIKYNVKVSPPGTNKQFTGNQLVSSVQVVPITTKTQGTTYTVTLTLVTQPTLTLLTGTIVPNPRPSPTPPTLPVSWNNGIATVQTLPNFTSPYTNQKIVGYNIISQGGRSSGDYSEAWITGTLDQAKSAAAATPGCSAFCYNKSTNKYILKGIPLPIDTSKITSDPTNTTDTYVMDRVTNPIKRVMTTWRTADPFVTALDGYIYYTYSASSGVVYLARYRGNEPVENMYSRIPSSDHVAIITAYDVIQYHNIECNDLKNRDGHLHTSLWSPKLFYFDELQTYILTFSMYTGGARTRTWNQNSFDRAQCQGGAGGRTSEMFFLYLPKSNVDNIMTSFKVHTTTSTIISGPSRPNGWRMGNRNMLASTPLFYNGWAIDASVYRYNNKYYTVAGVEKQNTDKTVIDCKGNIGTWQQCIGIQELTVTKNADLTITIYGKPDRSIILDEDYYDWEIAKANSAVTTCPTMNNYKDHEGPYFFINPITNKPSIMFNANYYQYPEYCLGKYDFTGSLTDDIIDKLKWEKSQIPVSSSTPSQNPDKKIYGPGGFTFINTNGKFFAFYHVTPSMDGNGTRVVVFNEFYFDKVTGKIILGTPTLQQGSPTTYLQTPTNIPLLDFDDDIKLPGYDYVPYQR